ncbi:MAG: hypothetical protein ACK6BC_15045 [Cyanobacteriota bacterium]
MTTKPATPRTARQRRRPRGYGERPTISQERHYLQVMVYSDCHRKLRDLMDRHNLSASGAAHHLMRLGAGLSPLPPQDHPSPTGEEPKP